MEAGLQAAMVQQGDLHRGIRAERLLQQFGDPLVDANPIGIAARPDELLVQVLLRRLLRRAEAAVGAEARAAGHSPACEDD